MIGYADDNCLSKASMWERALVAFVAKVEGVVIKIFSRGFAPRPPKILYYFLGPPIQNVLRGPWMMHRFFGMEDNNKRIPYPLVAHFPPQACLFINMNEKDRLTCICC